MGSRIGNIGGVSAVEIVVNDECAPPGVDIGSKPVEVAPPAVADIRPMPFITNCLRGSVGRVISPDIDVLDGC